jgi:DNA-binding Lrp family transcriptional regulator
MAAGLANPPALTQEERILVTAAQASFPLVPRPFAALGEKVGLSEDAVLERFQRLKASGVIRKIGPIFEPARFGLVSELVAVEAAPSHLEAVGAAAADWLPVTHCYEREHQVNLWFAAVAAGKEWFEQAAASAASLPGVRGVWRLPALRRFKIAVHFDLAAQPPQALTASSPENRLPVAGESAPSASIDIRLLSALETDLPLRPDPFSILASSLQIDTTSLLETLRKWTADGRIRRYGVMVNHHRLGFTANSMTAWAVPAAKVEEVGKRLASSPQITHCYERPAFPRFPYNVYAMIHGRSRQECLTVVEGLSEACGIHDAAALFSKREFKKSAPDYSRLLAERAVLDENQ